MGKFCEFMKNRDQYENTMFLPHAIEAIKKHGSFHGTILSIKRILKCNPVSNGGIDLVPNNKIKRKVNK